MHYYAKHKNNLYPIPFYHANRNRIKRYVELQMKNDLPGGEVAEWLRSLSLSTQGCGFEPSQDTNTVWFESDKSSL